MASSSVLFSSLLFVLLASMNAPVGASKQFIVGDAEGWREPNATESTMYIQWAATNRFHVGDSLRFRYKNDSVLVVDKYGYYHCNATNATTAFKDGNTVIELENPGPIYFISGNTDHCKNGQRLLISVMSLHSHHSPPTPRIANPPDSSSAFPHHLSRARLRLLLFPASGLR
ncbi:hypothetical protein NMG60_11002559, partial [Bertholletia excelsa]